MRNLFFLVSFLLPLLCFAQHPVSRYGKLKLEGIQLSSETGSPVQLRGISTHGPQWFGGCYSNVAFLDALSNDWKSDIFRLAMYVEEGGYVNDPTGWKRWIDNLVDEVGKRDMYCMIDWHVLADGDPMKNINAAKEFWDYMSKKHKDKKHVIYEICNEPNERYKYGASANEKEINWARIKEYAETIIPIIRQNDPKTMIIVGTPFWSNRPWRVVGNELQGANAINVMYTYHFYAGTPQHTTNFDTVKTIMSKIPLFVTEWGISEESGDGYLGLEEASAFANVLAGDNPAKVKISHCIWSFADKAESSALLAPYSCTNGTWNDRSAAGDKAFEIINFPKRDSSTSFPEPRIIIQPQNAVVNANAQTIVSAKGVGQDIAYQWQKSAEGKTWSDVQGAKFPDLIIPSFSTSNEGYYRVIVSNYIGYTTSQKAYLHLYGNGPYLGLPFTIPGKIEAEMYDIGGQNKSYYDNSTGNTPGGFRSDDVDIENTTDSLGGFAIGYWAADEWLEYSVNVLANSNYDFYFRAGSALSDKSFKVMLDGTTIVPRVNVPNVGNWSNFATVAIKGIALTKGAHKLRIVALTEGFNLNYMEVSGPNIDCHGDLGGNAFIDSCGFCAAGNTGIDPHLTKICYVTTDLENGASLEETFHVFPNPFHDKLTVRGSGPLILELFSIEGSKLLELKTASGEEQLSIPDHILPGLYQVRLSNGQSVKVLKLIKK